MVKDEHSALKASFERALEFLNAGDHVMAEKICRKAIKEISNSDPNIQVLLAVSLIRQGRSGSAVKRLKHTLRAFPDFPPAHEELGNALLAQNKPENAIEAFKKANRNDLVAKEEFEVKLLQTYMPEPLSSEDVEKEIDGAIKAADAKSMKDMGTVMSAVKLKVSGRANMAEVSQKIKEKLTNA